MPKLPKTTQKPTQPILLTTLRNTRPRKMANRKIHHTNKRTNRNQRRKCYAVSEKRLKINGGLYAPQTPSSAERRAANFWLMPQRTAPLFSTTDDRYGLEKSTLAIKKGRVGVWGLAPIIKLTPSAHRLLKKGVRCIMAYAKKSPRRARRSGGLGGEAPPFAIIIKLG